MKNPRHPPEAALEARVRLLVTRLKPATVRQYEHTVGLFVRYLRAAFPDVRRPCDLRRDPHIRGRLEHLWLWRARYSGKPLCSHTRGAHLIRLRKLLDLLADSAFPPRPGLLLSEDIPRPDQTLPRPLTPEDDTQLLAGLRRRTDLLANALLLTRHRHTHWRNHRSGHRLPPPSERRRWGAACSGRQAPQRTVDSGGC